MHLIDLCLKQLVEAGILGVRRCKLNDLRTIASATGGSAFYNNNFTCRDTQKL